MRVVIAGAGSVGMSVAKELLDYGHEVTIIDKATAAMRVAHLPSADWVLADACEIGTLETAGVSDCDVAVASTGDDKANLVFSLLCKTEFAVPRTVARVKNPKNEWMFDESWGVDVCVSMPRLMAAMVEEAVSVGELVRIFTFHQSGAEILGITLAQGCPMAGQRMGVIDWPDDTVLACIIRDSKPIAPTVDDTIEEGDELLFVVGHSADATELRAMFCHAAAEPSDGNVMTSLMTKATVAPADEPSAPPSR